MTQETRRSSIPSNSPPWTIRRRNTDWRHTNDLVDLARYIDAEITMSTSHLDAALETAQVVLGRLGLPVVRSLTRQRWLAIAGADGLYCHRRIIRRSRVPVLWQWALLDPAMTAFHGKPSADQTGERARYEAALPHATLVAVSTEAERERHAGDFPGHAAKFVALPLLSRVHPLTVEQAHAQADRRGRPLRLLFIGHEARRKGLDLVLAAIGDLAPALQRRVRLDVAGLLSDLDPATLARPGEAEVVMHGATSSATTQALLRDADIYVQPSRFESYGLAFVEAMANGCAVVGPAWEPQRDILEHGRAGVLVQPEVGAIRDALARLIEDDDARAHLMRAARRSFDERHALRPVAHRYAAAFARLTGRAVPMKPGPGTADDERTGA